MQPMLDTRAEPRPRISWGDLPPARTEAEDPAAVALRISSLGAEIERIGKALAPKPAPREVVEMPVTAADVRALIRRRRLRDAYFSTELFADPAWDILLDLTACRIEGRRVCVTSLTVAAAVPATTALRWIKTMTDDGMLVRRGDPTDARRAFIELSDDAFARMLAYLRTA